MLPLVSFLCSDIRVSVFFFLFDCFMYLYFIQKCLGSGAVGFAHLDGSCTEECVINMVHRIQELSMGFPDGRLEMSLIGGFTHVLRYSEQVFYSLMGK